MPGTRKHTAKWRGELKNLVRFQVGDTVYAFDVANVEEVVHRAPVTVLPHMGDAVTGVFDHRGRVTPIVDLRPRFGLAPHETKQAKWILMRTDQGLVGFGVDRVLDVVGTSEALDAPPAVGPGGGDRAIRGVVNISGNLVFVLDEGRLARVVGELDLPEQLDG